MMFQPQQELDVALPALDGADDPPQTGQAAGAPDAPSAYFGRPDLELWLDQADQGSIGGRKRRRRGLDKGEGDEG